MERVELLTELRAAVRHQGAAAGRGRRSSRFAQLVRLRSRRCEALAAADCREADESWAVILRDLPPASRSGVERIAGAAADRRAVAVRAARGSCARCSRAFEVTGLESLPASGAFIISPNHQSYLDPFLSAACCRSACSASCSSSARSSTSRRRCTRWVARIINLVPVDPDSNLVPAMKAGAFGLVARQAAGAVSRRRALDRRHREEVQEGRADPGAAPRACRSCRSRSRASTNCGRATGPQLEPGMAVERPPRQDRDWRADVISPSPPTTTTPRPRCAIASRNVAVI